jgi:hypothetical protein
LSKRRSIDRVRADLPNARLRLKLMLSLGLVWVTLRRGLHDDLKLFPYKIQIKQLLNDVDKQSRLDMCHWFNDMMEAEGNLIADVWFTDEAHFHLSGVANRQDYRYWGSEKPEEIA